VSTTSTTTVRDKNTPSGAGSTTIESALSTGLGRTQISDLVVSKIAGLATKEINGVYALGGGAARAFGSLRERIPGATSNVSQGVTVEVGERQAAVDLDIVVEYGVAVVELAASIRRNVIGAIERMTGLEVVEVNISVGDVHLPQEDAPQPAPAVHSSPRVA
jgi:uncharacterized alkaline shock family protein YloU